MNAQDLKNLAEAYTLLSTKKDDSYLETDMKKRRKNNEKARKDMEKMGTMKNPHFGEDVEHIDEISQQTKMRAFKDRATREFESDGDNPKDYTKSGKSKADQTKANIVKKHGKKAGEHGERAAHAGIFGRKSFSMPKKPTNEALDPVGKEDGDVNNDGKKNSTDKYLMKRRAAIGKAMGKKKMSEGIRDMDSEKGTAERKARLEKKRGMKMDDHPQYKKEELELTGMFTAEEIEKILEIMGE